MKIIAHMKTWVGTCVRLGRHIRGTGGNGGAHMGALLASLRPDGQTEFIRVAVNGSHGPTSVLALDAAQMREKLKGQRTGWQTVVLLPKSAYLIRRLQLPAVSAEEMGTMLRLEVEATLPERFGPVEVSYRRLAEPTDQGPCSCEVYICRLETLSNCLDHLRRQGVTPDAILPSATIWADLLSRWQDIDALVSGHHDADGLEVAALSSDGSCLVRAVCPDGQQTAKAPGRELTEFLRSLSPLASRHTLHLGCLGVDPAAIANGHVTAEDVTQRLQGPSLGAIGTLLRAAATAWPGLVERDVLQTANLMPHEAVARSRRRAAYRQTAVGSAAVVLAMLLSLVALKLASFRYRLANRELAAKIAHIKTRGEAVARQIAQLEAVRTTRSTCNHLARVIAALAAATPPEVGYSDVELSPTGQLRLRGQADSISLPFLLPEALEKQPALAQVVLQNVGQRQKGVGAASEFRVDCILESKQRAR